MLKKLRRNMEQSKNKVYQSRFSRIAIGGLVVMMIALSGLPVLNTNDKSPEVKPEAKQQIINENIQQIARGAQTTNVSRGNLNRDEVTLLAMVIQGESANEPFEGKVAVGSVILNRIESEDFPDTLSGVVYQKAAFEAVSNNMYKRPLSEESIKAAQASIEGWDPTNGALYFWNPDTATSQWVWSRKVTDTIGRHVFAK